MRPDLPAALRKVIRKGLEKTPAKRYQSARELLFDLELFQEIYSKVLVPLQKFEDELAAGCTGSEEQAKKFLYLGERYLDLATETISGLLADIPKGPQRTRLEGVVAVLSAAAADSGAAVPVAAPAKVGGAAEDTGGPRQEPAASAPGRSPAAAPVPPPEAAAESELAKLEELLEAQQIEAAIEKSQALLGRLQSAQVFAAVASLFYLRAIFDQTITVCEAGLASYADNAELHAMLGKALLQSAGRREAAHAALKRAHDLGSTDPEVEALYDDITQSRVAP